MRSPFIISHNLFGKGEARAIDWRSGDAFVMMLFSEPTRMGIVSRLRSPAFAQRSQRRNAAENDSVCMG